VSRKCPTCAKSFEDEVFFCGYDGTITVEEQDPSDFDLRLGKRLGGYIVVARVADGAMGRVYEGRHPETRARVAIKVLHGDVARDEVAVERFKREYETAAELDHPHIVKVLEFGETGDGSWFMTMEYLVGEELSLRLKRAGSLAYETVVRLSCQIALGLDHAHSFGVIHRDLKPDNIYVCDSAAGPDVRLLDFGSVKLQVETGPKLTAFGTTLGSPYYMSPEQAMGKQDVDQRTDVFALAAIMFELISGRICFEGSNVAEILMKIVSAEAPALTTMRPDVAPAVSGVVARALAKDKAQRYGTTVELAKALCAALGLADDPSRWAVASLDEIRVALGSATTRAEPAPATASNDVANAVPAADDPASWMQQGLRLSVSEDQRPRAAGPPIVLMLGLCAVALVALAGIAYWLVLWAVALPRGGAKTVPDSSSRRVGWAGPRFWANPRLGPMVSTSCICIRRSATPRRSVAPLCTARATSRAAS
jgi:serine/threonine-protein kinase